MSRSTDYDFFSVSTEEIEAELLQDYENISGLTLHPASPEYLVIKWVASILVHERVKENYALNQNIPSRAEGESLDALSELFMTGARTPAQAAECTVRFTLAEALTADRVIPAGTRVTDDSGTLYWETAATLTVPAGETAVEGRVQCQTAGTVGNGWKAGQLRRMVDVVDYVAACENVTQSQGGTDAMTDEEYYEAMRLSMDALSAGGARGSYIYAAKKVSTAIADVVVTSPEAGKVSIYALMEGGEAPGEEIKQKILASCSAEDTRPLTDHVTVESPEQVEYSIDLTYYRDKDTADISAAVRAAVREYTAWQGKRLGRDINPSKLIQLVMAAGAKRVEVRAPCYLKLEDGRGESGKTPQVATLGTESVIDGGVEDD